MEGRDLSSNDVWALDKLLDREAIRDLLNRYFYGLDRRDFGLLATCFASDAEGQYDGGKAVHLGREAIIETLRGIAQFEFSIHLMGNTAINLDGDRANAETHAVAFLAVDGSAEKGLIMARGLRYLDDLRKGPEGWQITHRVHIPLWQYEVTSIPPGLPRTE
jgi:hypothetical protein